MPPLLSSFWRWYERHERLHLIIASSLFFLQVIHLIWLSGHVVSLRVLGVDLFPTSVTWSFLLAIVDYAEIPALITVSLVYLHDLSKKFSWKTIWLLIALNLQWLHLFWITDAFVLTAFDAGSQGTVLPVWLAWVAILIDYLEIPVMVDTGRKLVLTKR